MAKAKARKLKVFQTSLGFNDSVIAVPSKAAALRAWGTHQDLFAQGFAKPATDQSAIDAALAHPETPLFRAVGSRDPFELKARSLPKVPDAPKPKRKAAAHNKPRKEEPPPDRSALDAAEAALKTLNDARREEEADFSRRFDALHREQEEARQTYLEARKRAEAAVLKARTAYRGAGGRD
jgi:hypothetical protein